MDTIKFKACGRYWALTRPGNLDSMVEAIAAEGFKDDKLPYWVELWPASLALCQWIEKNKDKIKDKNCLDLGCGLGFTAHVGSYFEANMLAMDYEREALTYAKKNAVVNQVKQPLWLNADWNKVPFKKSSISYMWASDIMYERDFIEPLMSFVDHVLKPEGVFWLADPNRNFYHSFAEDIEQRGFETKNMEDGKIKALEGHDVTVQIWEIKRKQS